MIKYTKILCLIAAYSFLTGCSLFHDDEEIVVKNPKPGTELEIKEEALPSNK